MAERVSSILRHLSTGSSSAKESLLEAHPDDVVITCALRTPLTKAGRGGLKDTPAEELLFHVLKGIRRKSNISPQNVEEICVGNVFKDEAAGGMRMAMIAAGFPPTTTSYHVNRMCSSGLLAIQNIATAIAAGAIEIGIAAGTESMSFNPDKAKKPPAAQIAANELVQEAIQPVLWTSEQVAGELKFSRRELDEIAAESYQKAEVAQKAGWFDEEILPINVWWSDPKTKEVKNITVTKDDGIRYGTTADTLSKIRVAAPQWQPGVTTAGNASQITDGAAGVLLMKRKMAIQLGQPILGKYVISTSAGLQPKFMGLGPVYSIPKLLGKVGLSLNDVDIFEVNEAFATAALGAIRLLGLDKSKVNPRGGAIAFGHPAGCTGVRQVVTALSELRRTKGRIAVTSMCVGTGMSMAALFVLEN
ncbi:putative peroxisomal 3-ketoacyl-CoA thiolase [Ilyonectria sp. MPI-CAGE-AT-0026]|nr:putative peroxisomal 3-ketoacyl-CoA thiolase [Ilyonectria sp. MPI-CAGE-AT-0026]